MNSSFPDLLSEVRAFRSANPEVRYVDLISLDIPGHFYGKRYPIDMLEKENPAELRAAWRTGRPAPDW
jgi:glutamine synthetase